MAENKKRMNERTFICSATDMSADDLFEEKQEDEFDKATQFASKYFEVFDECYKEAKKNRMRG